MLNRSTRSRRASGGRPEGTLALLALVASGLATGCERDDPETALAETLAQLDPPVFEVVATEYALDAPYELPSGWLTYRVNNETAGQIHEVSLARMPEGRTHADYMREVTPIWERVLEGIRSGEIVGGDEAYAVASEMLPEWAGEIEYVRSRGLVSPGRSTRNTVHLEPGDYVMECWVKGPDGAMHISHGMSRPLRVTDRSSEAGPPEPDLELSVAGGEIVTAGDLRRGDQTIALRVGDGVDYDNIHLIRVDESTDFPAVIAWMDWYAPRGLQAPEPVEFLGGVDAYGVRPPGGAVYFSLEAVEPGEYAWIVHAPAEERLWRRVTVN